MLTIRPSTPAEIPQQKALWQKCFGDPASYIDAFYRDYCTADQVLVVEEDGDINSIAAMLSAILRFPDGIQAAVGYVYALATNPYVQGKGHARQLLQYADRFLAKRGDKAMVLVPASPSLHKYFETTGMVECFSHRKVEILASSLTGKTGGGTIAPATLAEYNAIRDTLLAGSFYMAYPEQLIRFQQFGSRQAGADLYKLSLGNKIGCAAAEYVQSGRLLLKELLIAPEALPQAVELVAQALPAIRYHIRTPVCWEGLQGNYSQSFGMIKWYDDTLQSRYLGTQEAYLGLAFD